MAEWAQMGLYCLNISLHSLLPPRSTAEGDCEEEDDGRDAGRDPEEQVLHKLRPGSQLLRVLDVDLRRLVADLLLDEADVGVVNIDENDGGDLEEEDDKDADAVEAQKALALLLRPTEAEEGDEEGDSPHGEESIVEVLVAGSLLHSLLQPIHPLLHLVPLLRVPDLVGHLPQAPIVHNPPDASSQQEEAQQGQQGVGDDRSEPPH